ncbi:MAG: 30S ribosomal protein S11 [bacterium]|nr:30S ribosomal protein S11 [bacterium]
MGKKRIIRKQGSGVDSALRNRALLKLSKKKMTAGVLHVQATFNNTKLTLTDEDGNSVISSSSGALGFKGAKKGTPFAAAKVGELVGEKAEQVGVKEVRVIVKGIGSGRESSIRAFATKGVNITGIRDVTPVPHNGPRPRKARRV